MQNQLIKQDHREVRAEMVRFASKTQNLRGRDTAVRIGRRVITAEEMPTEIT